MLRSRFKLSHLLRPQFRSLGSARKSPLWNRFPAQLTTQRFSTISDASTFLNGTNTEYVDEMYRNWSVDPQSVHASWDVFFRTGSYSPPPTLGTPDYAGSGSNAHVAPTGDQASQSRSRLVRVVQLIRAFQVRGHFQADLDPLNLTTMQEGQHKELHISNYGFTDAELDSPIDLSDLRQMLTSPPSGFLSGENLTVRQVYDRLREIYCGSIGFEYMHIPDVDKCNWIRDQIETRVAKEITSEERLQILDRVTWADHFERALAKKYNTAKRFGLEGAESFIAGMKKILDVSDETGVNSVVIGMPHRGRLNVLNNVMRKPMEKIISEFDGFLRDEDDDMHSGDVKYHLGHSVTRELNSGRQIHLSLMANPSHLEAVDTVVAGKVRAKQYFAGDETGASAMGILLHGDAAMSGQGIVYETFGLGSLDGYSTGGTIHIVVNNQIGFTTDPHCSRSSPYCTDVAKSVNAPIFHVNGDDPEAVVKACELAARYRAEFLSDVVVDVVCYRQHGHNEIDEPAFTQPLMYNLIRKKPSVLQTYGQRLVDAGKLSVEAVQGVSDSVNSMIMTAIEKSSTYEVPQVERLGDQWGTMVGRNEYSPPRTTGVSPDTLSAMGAKLCAYPEDFKIHPRLKTVVEKKRQTLEAGEGLDWSAGEALAFATLLAEGTHVRLSGQDVERGTFSHRHSVLHDQKTGGKFTPLNNLGVEQETYDANNSNLSEFGVLGFELGYSMEQPNQLVMWEAQFGDFANGAQIIFDQFMSSQEDKWLRQSGLVALLPHGYEGMGPEHSSARLERFLTLCNIDLDTFPERNPENPVCAVQQTNWQVIVPTTPANIFHALRRQVHRGFRKPLVVMSPKSLLRHPAAKSDFADMAEGTSFSTTYPDSHPTLVPADSVRKLVFCSGKVYYDLDATRNKDGVDDVAIVRIEELNPFPFHKVADYINEYPNAEVVWCQEEPKNQGGYNFVETALRTSAIQGAGRPETFDVLYAGRKPMSATSTGHAKVHHAEQADLIAQALA